MSVCRACSGEAVRIEGDRTVPRGCDECVAQSLIKHKNNKFGITTLEKAKKLCSCLANGHKGEKVLGVSEEIDRINQELHKQRKDEEKESSERKFKLDKDREKEIGYIQRRLVELKELDENGPEWVLEYKYDEKGELIPSERVESRE